MHGELGRADIHSRNAAQSVDNRANCAEYIRQSNVARLGMIMQLINYLPQPMSERTENSCIGKPAMAPNCLNITAENAFVA